MLYQSIHRVIIRENRRPMDFRSEDKKRSDRCSEKSMETKLSRWLTLYREFVSGAYVRADGYVFTAPVCLFSPNAFGLYNIIENIWEWVEDCNNPDYLGAVRLG
jgi:formylglycine-generating enzyme required for sulfatase activity